MEVLTQEMFNKLLNDFCFSASNRLVLENYIVKDISADVFRYLIIHIIFKNCRIESLRIEHMAMYELVYENCEIVDYEDILFIEKASIVNCTFIKPVPLTCPEKGEFIGYKKCEYWDKKEYRCRYCVVKLLIPTDAKRSSAFGRKCRCSKAKVLGIFSLEGDELKHINSANSLVLNGISYELGKEVYPDDFNDNRYEECSHGIHFFMSFDEARYYYFM